MAYRQKSSNLLKKFRKTIQWLHRFPQLFLNCPTFLWPSLKWMTLPVFQISGPNIILYQSCCNNQCNIQYNHTSVTKVIYEQSGEQLAAESILPWWKYHCWQPDIRCNLYVPNWQQCSKVHNITNPGKHCNNSYVNVSRYDDWWLRYCSTFQRTLVQWVWQIMEDD